jgi:hypothetical protein
MIFCTASTAWSHPVSSPCYTEHDQRCGDILSSRITTIAMSRSGQLGRRCTVEPNCSDLSTRLVGASVTHECSLEICEPSCVLREAKPFFIPVVHSPLRVMGYIAAPKLSSRGGRARSHGTCGSGRAHLGREARSGAKERVAAPELNSSRRGLGPRGSTGAHLDSNARSGAEEHVAAPELNSARRRGPGPRDTWQHRSPPRQEGEVQGCRTRESTGAHLDREERSGAIRYVAACGYTPCSLS